MARTTISFGIRGLVQRHAACEGTVLGTKEMESMKKLTTKDDLELFKGYLKIDKDTWLK